MSLSEKMKDIYDRGDQERIEDEARKLEWKRNIDFSHKYRARVVYDSGTFFEFWVHGIFDSRTSISWMPVVGELPQPARINVDKVESIWFMEKVKHER